MQYKALSFSEFSCILSKNFIFENNPHIAISFSGGSDSMALLLLMKQWIKKKNGKLTVIHFNHHLREESEDEVRQIKKTVRNLKLQCKVLNWYENKPKSGIMQNARDQRYKKIINFCKEKQIISLMTAHHLDDCIETFLMRKQRKFTTIGLGTIPMINNQENIQILRPFINIKKGRLIQTCMNNDIKWIDDPSNNNVMFERVRIRKILSNFKIRKIKFIEQELKTNTKKILVYEQRITEFFLRSLEFYEYGKFSLSIKRLLFEPEFIQIEVLKKILVTCSGTIYPPRYRTLKILLDKIKNFERFRFSIHSCIVSVKEEDIEFYREYQKIVKSIPERMVLKKNNRIFWDSRFIIESNSTDVICLYMKDEIWLKLKKKFDLIRKRKEITFDILKTLPILKIKNDFLIPYLSSCSELLKNSLKVTFYPKVPLTKKNF